jgi:protein gp37
VLRETPAAVRFISAEPLLGPLLADDYVDGETGYLEAYWRDGYRGGDLDLLDIDWLICGGESGPGCRPMRLEWARDLRDAAAIAGTEFFLKQIGGHPDKRGGEKALLDGHRHTAMPARAGSTSLRRCSTSRRIAIRRAPPSPRSTKESDP